MPTPSFDELLSRARQIGEAEADSRRPNTGALAAKGASDFVMNLLNSPVSPRRTTGGYLTPQGEYQALAQPVTRGGTLIQTLADRLMPKAPDVPEGAFGLSPEKGEDFAIKAAMENIRGGYRVKTADLRAKAMTKAQGMRISATTQPMVKEASDYVWALAGRDPDTETLPILTFGDADRMLRAKGIDSNAEMKSLGFEISLFKDPLFGIPEGERDRLQTKITDKKKGKLSTPYFGSLGNAKGNGGPKNYKSVQEAVADGKGVNDVVTINGEKVTLAP